MDRKKVMTELSKDIVKGSGAVAVGIATTETLEGGPPSTDLSYVLPEARSAVVFSLPLDQKAIERFLKKEDMASANIDNRQVNILASGIALTLAEFLVMKGYRALPMTANAVYRKDTPGGVYDEKPPVSHRYLAVRSGVGYFGLSGNVIMETYGAATILASVVTDADLIPTEPLPPEDNYCDHCRLCISACASGMMAADEKTTVTIGGMDYSYSKRLSYHRCEYVCGGFTGLHRSGKWSTWSPARFPIPEMDDEFMGALRVAADPYVKRAKVDYGLFHPLMPRNRLQFTCGHCQFLCHPERKVRRERYKMIVGGGVVVQEADGTLKRVSPKEARKSLSAMDEETRKLYE